jgi:hypothetical protein
MGDSRGNDLSNFVDKAVLGSANQSVSALNPPADFVIFFGDNSIMGDDDRNGTNNFTYQDWYNFMRTPPTGLPVQTPLYLVVGNHELYQLSLGNEVQSYTSQTGYQVFMAENEMLSPGTLNPNITNMPGHENLDYSFTSPDQTSLFVVLDGFYVPSSQNIPYVDAGNLDESQLMFLNNTLATSQASNKFVITHNPAFTPTNENYDTAVDPSMAQFWQILDNNDVTAALAGHVHGYSRVMVDSSFTSGNPNPNPGLYFNNTIPQIIAGSVGAPLIGTVTNEPSTIYVPASWNWKNLYNYSVVDVDTSDFGTSTVTVNSYGSDGTSPWTLCDSFTETTSPEGSRVFTYPASSSANGLQLLQNNGTSQSSLNAAASAVAGGIFDTLPASSATKGSQLLQYSGA